MLKDVSYVQRGQWKSNCKEKLRKNYKRNSQSVHNLCKRERSNLEYALKSWERLGETTEGGSQPVEWVSVPLKSSAKSFRCFNGAKQPKDHNHGELFSGMGWLGSLQTDSRLASSPGG